MSQKHRWGQKFIDKRDWKSYNEHLIQRGEYFINPAFLDTWIHELEEMNGGKIGQPFRCPNSMIEFLAIMKCKGFDYRSLEGILRGFSEMLGGFPVISFSQIRRRILTLTPSFDTNSKDLVVGVDGSGMKVTNRGDWIRYKWKVKRGWIKVVLLGDINGNIIDLRIGNENLDERAASRGMIRKNRKNIKKVLGDGLHDVENTFNLCEKLNIQTGIKIRKNAVAKGLGRRPREVRMYQELGYDEWANQNEYGLRWPATEGIFSAVKRIFGESVMSHKKRFMYHEVRLKFWAYQQLRNV